MGGASRGGGGVSPAYHSLPPGHQLRSREDGWVGPAGLVGGTHRWEECGRNSRNVLELQARSFLIVVVTGAGRAWEAEAGGPKVQSQPGLFGETPASSKEERKLVWGTVYLQAVLTLLLGQPCDAAEHV